MTQPPVDNVDNAGNVDKFELFRNAHKYSDVDQDFGSLHHTLGYGPNQAAPGNHQHKVPNHQHPSSTGIVSTQSFNAAPDKALGTLFSSGVWYILPVVTPTLTGKEWTFTANKFKYTGLDTIRLFVQCSFNWSNTANNNNTNNGERSTKLCRTRAGVTADIAYFRRHGIPYLETDTQLMTTIEAQTNDEFWFEIYQASGFSITISNAGNSGIEEATIIRFLSLGPVMP